MMAWRRATTRQLFGNCRYRWMPRSTIETRPTSVWPWSSHTTRVQSKNHDFDWGQQVLGPDSGLGWAGLREKLQLEAGAGPAGLDWSLLGPGLGSADLPRPVVRVSDLDRTPTPRPLLPVHARAHSHFVQAPFTTRPRHSSTRKNTHPLPRRSMMPTLISHAACGECQRGRC